MPARPPRKDEGGRRKDEPVPPSSFILLSPRRPSAPLLLGGQEPRDRLCTDAGLLSTHEARDMCALLCYNRLSWEGRTRLGLVRQGKAWSPVFSTEEVQHVG